MKIGLYDVDSHNFPNLPLMKISAWHKSQGDEVEWWFPMMHYDKVYVSKVFGDEYSQMDMTAISADEIVFGGTGFAITVEDGKEVYHKDRDKDLPYEIEHIYPDYSLYPELTKDTAYGFLTRGCPRQCAFCHTSKKDGKISHKVCDLTEFWNGQKNIVLLDQNILACKDWKDLLQQLIDSKANVEFNGGLDIRLMTEEKAEYVKRVKQKIVHFAWDRYEDKEIILPKFKMFKEISKFDERKMIVYTIVNHNTTFEQDMDRITTLRSLGYSPYVMVYNKESLGDRHILKELQRWCNNRFIYRSGVDFYDYIPRADGKTIREIYGLC
jgi:hypothetical protein